MRKDVPTPHPSQLDVDARERVRKRSKKFFGSSDRVEVAIAVALSPDRTVNATDLHWELRLATNRVRAQLVAMADASLLVEGAQGENAKRMFVRADDDDPFWEFCRRVYLEAIG